jgi:hypothetical protein
MAVYGSNDEGAQDLGVDYAFMFLMTLSPDFAAANYTIDNENGSDVDIAIGRFLYHIDVMQDEASRLQAEFSFAYQSTEQVVRVLPDSEGAIDSRWDTYGIGAGLLYERDLSQQLRFTQPARRNGENGQSRHVSRNCGRSDQGIVRRHVVQLGHQCRGD